MYDVLWDWKKELDGNSYIQVVGSNFDVRIACEDHISCINDIVFIIRGSKNIEFAIPIYKIEFMKLHKIDGRNLL